MGWKDIANRGRDWAEAKKTELLTTDNHARERAAGDLEEVTKETRAELVTSFLEGVLPDRLAQKVTDARPENVEARESARAAQEEAARRDRLEEQATAPVSLTVSGGERGTLELELPVEVEERPAEAPYDEGPAPLAWLIVRVETPDPVPFGSTTFGTLSLAVPGYAGPGRYDLVDLMRRSEAGEVGWWEAIDLSLVPGVEADDTTWFADLSSGDAAWVEVGDGAVRFELPMRSAVNAILLTGTVRWA